MSEEEKARAILTHAAATGLDPILALKKHGLLWTRETLFSARTEALRAAADVFDDLVDSEIPREAKQSPGSMKVWIAGHLRELAERQKDDSSNQN